MTFIRSNIHQTFSVSPVTNFKEAKSIFWLRSRENRRIGRRKRQMEKNEQFFRKYLKHVATFIILSSKFECLRSKTSNNKNKSRICIKSTKMWKSLRLRARLTQNISSLWFNKCLAQLMLHNNDQQFKHFWNTQRFHKRNWNPRSLVSYQNQTSLTTLRLTSIFELDLTLPWELSHMILSILDLSFSRWTNKEIHRTSCWVDQTPSDQ